MGVTRIGVMVIQSTPADDLITRWKRAEELGFDSIWLADRLQYPDQVQLEAWTTLGALARETTRVRIGALVTQITFRPPGLLAQMEPHPRRESHAPLRRQRARHRAWP